MPHVVAFLAYPGFQLLDVTGPAAVFDEANHVLLREDATPFYHVEILSAAGGAVTSSSGIQVQTRALARISPSAVDTFLISGAHEKSLLPAMRDPVVRRWVPRFVHRAKRFGSICSGTFVLASLGLLNGKRVATHWNACAPLAKAYPEINVDADVVYVADGNIWTSAGVTTGIDMALTMVGRDHDASVANAVARQLVLYARRPGYQSQFSPLLRAQVKEDDPFAELIAWIQVNLAESLDVTSLAGRVGLTERTFYRRFIAVMGESPARFVESVRLEAARTLLSKGRQLKAVAAEVGLPPARLRGAFGRRFGLAPRLFREMHAEEAPSSPAVVRKHRNSSGIDRARRLERPLGFTAEAPKHLRRRRMQIGTDSFVINTDTIVEERSYDRRADEHLQNEAARSHTRRSVRRASH